MPRWHPPYVDWLSICDRYPRIQPTLSFHESLFFFFYKNKKFFISSSRTERGWMDGTLPHATGLRPRPRRLFAFRSFWARGVPRDLLFPPALFDKPSGHVPETHRLVIIRGTPLLPADIERRIPSPLSQPRRRGLYIMIHLSMEIVTLADGSSS